MSEQKYKSYRYYEGLCSTKDIVKELAKVLSIGVRSNEVKDVEGNTLLSPFILQSKNWDIVYPKADSTINIDWNNMTAEEYKSKILNQINQITDTVILKTETTPVEINSEQDDLNEDNDKIKESLTMYLEIYKPTYVANPEEYPLDCEREGVIPKVITKDMYKDSLSITKRIEEVITLPENACCSISPLDETNKNTIVYKESSEFKLIISKIISIYGENAEKEGFYAPTIPGASTSELVFDKTKILEIKAKDNDLYTTIRTALNVDDNQFQNFTKLKFQAVYEGDTKYILSVEAITTKNIYTVSGSYSVKEASATDIIINPIVPEYYIDGIYIPLDSSLWQYDPTVLNNRGILFSTPITGDIAKNGNIVIRYDVEKDAHEDVSERTFMLNNHYLLMRLFDDLNEEGNGPSETTYNDKGEVITQKAHVSDFCKLSWYQDFEEIYQDEIDADISTNTISDGTLLVPLQTAGLNGETKIRYWLNTNNDRFNLVIMGNPSLDYSRDRHLISACYCGKIDSFDFSINDTAGNFALFVSSSTEPCKSELTKEKTYNVIEYTGDNYSSKEFIAFLQDAYSNKCIEGVTEYYVQLPEGRYYNKSLWPKYIVLDAYGTPVTEMKTVYQINYLEDNQAVISIHQSYDSTHTLYIGYPYYEEKVVLNGGVERDIFGNVVNVQKTDTFGLNTSDGTTSVMMYHTQSKAYYQKHHMMFTTTEEYMSKVMYGKSLYTNEYYADRIKITHGNDGPRGMLNDMLVIDSSSLYPFDELVINKDFEKDPEEYEETYVYFPVTAPYSPLSDSPNARYGIAIKKNEVEPDFSDEKKIVEIAIDELKLLANESWWGISSNIYPLSKTSNGSSVLWSIVPNSQWMETEDNKIDYNPIDVRLVSTGLKGESSVPLTAETIDNSKLTSVDTFSGSKLYSEINFDVTGFTADTSTNKLYYGVVPVEPKINEDAVIRVRMIPPNNEGAYATEDYYYGVDGVPFCGEITSTSGTELLTLKNAKPNYKFIVYEVEEAGDNSLIKKFGVCNLTQDLIKYPCEIKISIVKGSGLLESAPISIINYEDDYTATVKPDTGLEVDKVEILDADGNTSSLTKDDLTKTDDGKYIIKLTNVIRDTNISVSFTSGTV